MALRIQSNGVCACSTAHSGLGKASPSTFQVATTVNVYRTSRSLVLSASSSQDAVGSTEVGLLSEGGFSRREAMLSGVISLVCGVTSLPAFADFDEEYKKETQAVIDQVKGTLALEKTDPSKPVAVTALRQTSNDWVAKYRRVKKIAGRPSFSNMYSVLNAISGHYINFGPTYPIPVKRKERILEEVTDAEKALSRGR